MKKFLLPLIASGFLFGANNATVAQDPFEQMDKLFKMQMQQMEAMQKQMDAMFKALESQTPSVKMPVIVSSGGIMSSGLQDKGDHYEIAIKKGDSVNSKVNVEAKNGVLTIKVEETKAVDKNTTYGVVKSYSSSSYMQSFTLPKDADENKVSYDTKDNNIIVKIAKKDKK